MTEIMHVDDEQAQFTVRALYGPPRPVLVVSILGEVDCVNDRRLFDLVAWATAVADGPRAKEYFGCRRVAPAVVVDLRRAEFVGVGTLSALVHEVDVAGLALRFVVAHAGVVRRALSLLDDVANCDVYTELTDAVLADVVVPG